ncbi:hypothetical protein J2Z69_001318 [Paenibacillus shirakamiensis]|uniref:Uncharacterized protein n=1 Tax=Paenibacillus shirakamiensis TaxID=1265935 RepID=A0ABS4JF12_9BACL|nr:hypothetical protein [Paenibacillus shirakamiensis]
MDCLSSTKRNREAGAGLPVFVHDYMKLNEVNEVNEVMLS